MALRKIFFPLILAVILAGCTAETEFNPIGGSESKNAVSKTDDVGDDEGSSSSKKSSSSQKATSSEIEDMLIVSSYDELLVCSAKREGMDAYVKDEKSFYACYDGKWVIRREGPDVMVNSSSSSAGVLDPDTLSLHMMDSILAAISRSSSSVLIMPGLSSSSVFFPGMSSSSVSIPNISSSSYTPIITPPTYHSGFMTGERYIGEY